MTLCTSCGTENAEGMKFCVKCGAALAPAPDPGAWKAPSGSLYDTPATPSGGLNQPGSYAPPPVAYTGYSGMATSGGVAGMPYALWADRVLAALIDTGLVVAVMIVLYIILTVFFFAGAAVGSASETAGGLIASTSCCLFILLPPLSQLIVGVYNKVFLVAKRGASIGQGVMKLKVVDDKGSIIPMNTAALRLLVITGFTIIPFLPLLSILWPLWDEQRQALHDKAVGTFVVKTGA